MDPVEVCEEFAELIKDMKGSREMISKATKLVVDNPYIYDELFHLLLKRIRKVSPRKRGTLFYLVDSICQVSKRKGLDQYVALLDKSIVDLVSLVSEKDSDGSTNAEMVQKVLTIWQSRHIVSDEVASKGIKELQAQGLYSASATIATTRHKRSSSGSGRSGEENSNYRSEVFSEEEVRKLLKKMEEFRRECKRLRWEASLRPENDEKLGEFDEMWTRTAPQNEVTESFAKYDDRGHNNGNSDIERLINAKYPAIRLRIYGDSPVQPQLLEPTNGFKSPLSPVSSSPTTPATPYSPTMVSPRGRQWNNSGYHSYSSSTSSRSTYNRDRDGRDTRDNRDGRDSRDGRDRERDRDRDRESYRERERDRDRDRERERGKDRESYRDRERDRDREHYSHSYYSSHL